MITENLRALRKAALGLAVVLTLGMALPSSAQADPDGRGQHGQHDRGRGPPRREAREWREHERSAYYWRSHRSLYYYPGYVYAPPPVVYYPPEPSPGISFIIPLYIR